ncbi:hypothetical protein QBC46DRAFT_358955 [Diplogelasinospora grovesii]|uniref:Uncharacterized protein n=1 Tax=Diplogelasinospora grovesii TaxID=303347 RepID=A0AAN6MZ28_9PEZI|nr:hypothetical protein QBC46DRAFT_358955 [Diplogelasinospora grovesii]
MGFDPRHSEAVDTVDIEDTIEVGTEPALPADPRIPAAAGMGYDDMRQEVRDRMIDRHMDRAEAEAGRDNRPVRTFKVGNWVWEVRDKPGKEVSKFEPTWMGPMKVIEKISPVSYTMEPIMTEGRPHKAHVDHLKIYYRAPDWVKDKPERARCCDDPEIWMEANKEEMRRAELGPGKSWDLCENREDWMEEDE